MQNYRRHIEEHLLPAFEDLAVADILASDVDAWTALNARPATPPRASRPGAELCMRDDGRPLLEEGLRDTNPASSAADGKRAGRSRDRRPEKAIADALQVPPVAERAALLSGRDDEFVAIA